MDGNMEMLIWLQFQSALPRGERRCQALTGQQLLCLSIRAPTRGATFTSNISFDQLYTFNPRSHEGSDVTLGIYTRGINLSIRAPTRGATLLRNSIRTHLWTFNPRSHEGSDVEPILLVNNKVLSIRAPTRGATMMPTASM